MLEQDRIIKINIEEEMNSSYIDYSMSVIVSRALPDVRDGFKPVQAFKKIINYTFAVYQKPR